MTAEWDDELLQPGPAQSERSQSWLTLIVGACALGTLVFLLCGGGLWFTLLRPSKMPDIVNESREQKRAALQQAFSSVDVGVDAALLAQLNEFFDRVIEASSAGDESAFRRLVDRDRLYEAMKASGRMPAQWAVIEGWNRDWALQSVWIPSYSTRFRIAYAEQSVAGEHEELVVYGYFWDTLNDAAEMRWWLVKGPAGWRAYDWELLQFGLRGSHELALFEFEDTSTYFQLYEELREADGSRQAGDLAAVERRLRRAEELIDDVPILFRDEARLWTAYHWRYAGDLDEAIRIAEGVAEPEDKPGVILLQMLYAAENRRFDEALALASRYEAAVGENPNSLTTRIQAAWETPDRDALARACQKYLRVDPGHVETLTTLALALPSEQKPQLSEFVVDADDPAAAVRELAHTLSRYGDVESLRVLESYAAEHLTIGLSDHIHGIREELLGHDHAAAEAWRRAQRDEEAAMWRYEEAMTRLGRVIEAYENADDQHEAFLRFAGTMFVDEDHDGLQRLLDAHEPHRDEDPWWWYYAAQIALGHGDAEQALHCLQRGQSVAREIADDEAETSIRQNRRALLIERGLWRDEYSQSDETDTCFEELAAFLDTAGRYGELAELVELYKPSDPNGPWPHFYAATVAVHSGDTQVADRMLQKLESTLPDDAGDDLRQRVRDLRVEAHLNADDPISAYAVDSTADVAEQILFHYSARRDWSRVKELAAYFRQESADDPVGWLWGLDALWMLEDYEEVDSLAREFPRGAWERVESYRRIEAEEQIARSRLRIGKLDQVAIMPDGADASYADRWQLLAAIASGRTEEALALLREPSLANNATVGFDPDGGPTILQDPAYQPWLAESPPEIPGLYEAGWVILQNAAPKLTENEIQSHVSNALGEDVTITPVRTADGAAYQIEAEHGGAACLIVVGTDPYVRADVWSRPSIGLDDPSRAALERHTSWIACVTVSPFQMPSAAPDDRIVRSLLNEQSAGLYRLDTRQLVSDREALGRLAGASSGFETELAKGAQVMLWHQPPSGRADGRFSERVRRRLTPALYKVWCGDASDLVADVVLRGVASTEVLTIRVVEAVAQPYAGWELRGTLIQGATCVPELTAGRLVQCGPYGVIDWTLGGEEPARQEAEGWWKRTHPQDANPKGKTAD